MRKIVCRCDICGDVYSPTFNPGKVDCGEFVICATDDSGQVMMDDFDICSKCLDGFRENVKKLLKYKVQNDTTEVKL